MPQLNPSPWLMIYFFTWTTFIFMLSKLLKTHHISKIQQDNQNYKPINWDWPWL
uniref:ATP synthase complex subunit 8 n=1 Tax=Meroles squamulosus TaxID=80448 RepID=A0A8A3WSS7_9SAUR|nr:ATP synthase F0 subunit 8 [Meroles squamulosus]QTA72646.1 ATP synthase F0 subunit 8 [Meroles squamulosus]